MWIVQLALRRPYTFVIMAMLIVILGVVAIFRMPTDIFPEINIPVVSVDLDLQRRLPGGDGRGDHGALRARLHRQVNDIDHIESQSLPGLAVIRVFFHPNARIDAAVAQMSAASQSVLKALPTGITPPNIIRYNASSVPILQLGLSSDTLTEAATLRPAATTLSAPRWRTCRAPVFRCPTAGSRARSWWT